MIKRTALRLFAFTVLFAFILTFFTGCADKEDKRVLLISIDGLRADAIENTEYGRYLLENSSYSLSVTTVSPSVTLPCHMSMFHSVSPIEHGVSSNVYTPSESLGYGITEALKKAGKSSAIFYNWREIGYLVTEGSAEKACYIPGESDGWEETNKLLGEEAISHILNTPTDFTFLYLGFLDEWGHRYGWLSEEYYYALNESFSLIKNVISEAEKQNYTVIITTDHGGHDKTHGTDRTEDMTIPLFIMGEDFTNGKNLGARSILDIAPTVADILGVKTPEVWQGKSCLQ